MIKPESLRAHLTAALPDLARDPDRLLVFVDAGALAANLAPGLSFEYRYTLTLILTDFASDPNAVMVPLLAWISVNQPDILANYDRNRSAITFEAELLSNGAVDLQIKVPLTESIGVTPKDGGGYEAIARPEDPPEQPFPPGHWQLYVKGELVAEWDSPGAAA